MSEEATVVSTWRDVQKALREAQTDREVWTMIEQERAGLNRLRWIYRMYGRFKVLRAQREEGELGIGSMKRKEK